MLSIWVTSLPMHGQIFDHVEVSTQYDFIFGCDITFQFVKEDFPLGGVYWERINLSFCASTVTDIIRPALCEFSNSTLKFLDPCKVLLLRFWCYRAMKKSATYPLFFPKNNVFISTMRFRRSIISNFKLRKVWKILFLLLLSWRPRTFKDAISNLLILKNL